MDPLKGTEVLASGVFVRIPAHAGPRFRLMPVVGLAIKSLWTPGTRLFRNVCTPNLTPSIYVHTIIGMKITFDPAKDTANIAKHGVSLSLAADLEWDSAMIWPDARRDYGEARRIGLALTGTRLYSVIFTDRGNARRVISLRKANEREVRRYVSEN